MNQMMHLPHPVIPIASQSAPRPRTIPDFGLTRNRKPSAEECVHRHCGTQCGAQPEPASEGLGVSDSESSGLGMPDSRLDFGRHRELFSRGTGAGSRTDSAMVDPARAFSPAGLLVAPLEICLQTPARVPCEPEPARRESARDGHCSGTESDARPWPGAACSAASLSGAKVLRFARATQLASRISVACQCMHGLYSRSSSPKIRSMRPVPSVSCTPPIKRSLRV